MLERNQAIKTIYSNKKKKGRRRKGGCMKLKRRQPTLMLWQELIEDCKTRKGKEKKKIIDWIEKRQGKDHVVWESLDQKSRH
jgi:hypothetical protein